VIQPPVLSALTDFISLGFKGGFHPHQGKFGVI